MLVSKVNDICQCYCAIDETFVTGNIITGSANVVVNGSPVAVLHSIVQGACGHTGFLLCSTKNRVNSLPIATIGVQVYGVIVGNVITGSPNVGSL